jgi:hypothetical protein
LRQNNAEPGLRAMTYLDRYRSMTATELADEADVLFRKVAICPQGTGGLIELRNMVPFLVEHLRRQAKDLNGRLSN